MTDEQRPSSVTRRGFLAAAGTVAASAVSAPRVGRCALILVGLLTAVLCAAQTVDWWEGNVAVGPRGVLYAGNTGGTVYAVRPDGSQLWAFTAGNSLWTTPAFAADGSSFWGSLDLHI